MDLARFCEPSNTTAKHLKNKARGFSDPVPARLDENSVRLGTFGVRLVTFGEAHFFQWLYYLQEFVAKRLLYIALMHFW
jgi:hypothetical protein